MAGVRSAMRNYNHFGEGSRTVNDGDVSAVKPTSANNLDR